MSLAIDLIIIIAAIAAVYLGIVRGFVRSVMHFSSLILALAAVFLLTPTLSGWINENFVAKEVTGITESSLSGIVSTVEDEHGEELEKVIEDRPDALTEIADRFSVSMDAISDFYNTSLKGIAETVAISRLADMIAGPTAQAISTVIAAVVIFAAALLILKLITFILDMIFHLPVLDKLNTLLGFVFGLGSALVTSWLIANLSVGLINALGSINNEIFNEGVIKGSLILNFFYNTSLIIF